MGQIPISYNGTISKTTLLVLAGVFLTSGVIDIEIENLFYEGTLKILLGCLILFVREHCKTVPNGDKDASLNNKPKRKW
jgi:hypothetical protein